MGWNCTCVRIITYAYYCVCVLLYACVLLCICPEEPARLDVTILTQHRLDKPLITVTNISICICIHIDTYKYIHSIMGIYCPESFLQRSRNPNLRYAIKLVRIAKRWHQQNHHDFLPRQQGPASMLCPISEELLLDVVWRSTWHDQSPTEYSQFTQRSCRREENIDTGPGGNTFTRSSLGYVLRCPMDVIKPRGPRPVTMTPVRRHTPLPQLVSGDTSP